MADMRLVVAGAGGRMGRTLINAIAATKGVTLAGAVEAAGSAVIGRDAGELAGLGANGINVISDVASAAAWHADGADRVHHPGRDRCAFAELARRPASRTSWAPPGIRPSKRRRLPKPRSRAPIVKSGNMSLGVNLLAALVKRVAQTLGEEYDIEIVEMHHNKKIDAPSGTALMFGRAAAAGPRHRSWRNARCAAATA